MQSFFRSNQSTNQNQNSSAMQNDMPMQQRNMQDDMTLRDSGYSAYDANVSAGRDNMNDYGEMSQNQNDRQMQNQQQNERRVPNSQQPTRPVSHGFVAPSGNDNYFENSVAYQGAMQQILSENTGEFVSVDFLIGTQETVTKRGVLYAVGVSYIVLYNPEDDTYIVCDLFAIKFVTFYNTTQN